ncbi:electron transfer flavoprotein subunit alpha/FixB family protein [Thermodesulfobacteriota bacterium]
MRNVWILTQHRKGVFDEVSFGLIAEARRLLSQEDQQGIVTAVVLGFGLFPELDRLGAFGADRVVYMEDKRLSRYQGDMFAEILCGLVTRDRPFCLLVSQTSETSDLSARLATKLETGLVTCAMDLQRDSKGGFVVTRPVAGGYLFEDVRIDGNTPPIVCFLPSVLTALNPERDRKVEIRIEPLGEIEDHSGPRVIRVMEAESGDLNIEEADLIVAGGRGVGKGDAFEIIHELASVMGGSVAATRPIIDWKILPYERQIGQTGKSVGPRLIINCGISGANEYTAGMEKAQQVIAINKDPGARIFRFADLGVVADVHSVLPILISRIREMKE